MLAAVQQEFGVADELPAEANQLGAVVERLLGVLDRHAAGDDERRLDAVFGEVLQHVLIVIRPVVSRSDCYVFVWFAEPTSTNFHKIKCYFLNYAQRLFFIHCLSFSEIVALQFNAHRQLRGRAHGVVDHAQDLEISSAELVSACIIN